ncbi:hypothetical protein M404DRAFT_65300, partial [Pisolithus tinctorius Marx 270]
IRKHNILCTALQETKLKQGEESELENIAPKLIILNNPSEAENRSAGTAFALNKDLLKNKKLEHTIIIPRRAARLKIKITDEQTLDLINIYSPNELGEKHLFWLTLKNKINQVDDWENPIILGDFNFVENPIDRLPAHADDATTINTFKEIKETLHLIDGWRAQNPQDRMYTYKKQNPTALARLDRIYINIEQTDNYQHWEVAEHCNLSDHHLVITEMTPLHMPLIGLGLWRL